MSVLTKQTLNAGRYQKLTSRRKRGCYSLLVKYKTFFHCPPSNRNWIITSWDRPSQSRDGFCSVSRGYPGRKRHVVSRSKCASFSKPAALLGSGSSGRWGGRAPCKERLG